MERSIPWWLRTILWLAAAQALLLLLALFAPQYVNLLVPWPASPLNSRFIASRYVSLGLGVLLCSMARSFREMRLVLFGIGMATILLFFLTVLRMYFHPGELKQFPTFWLLFYIVDPLLVAFAFWRFGWGDTTPRGTSSSRFSTFPASPTVLPPSSGLSGSVSKLLCLVVSSYATWCDCPRKEPSYEDTVGTTLFTTTACGTNLSHLPLAYDDPALRTGNGLISAGS